MGRLVQAAMLVMCMVGVASAAPSRKVRVESTPSGATVYIDSVENGQACAATPCTIDVPLGERTLIVRLDKYGPEFAQVTVTRGTRPLKVAVTLKSALGTLRVLNAPKGAIVKVNDEDQGKVTSSPFEIEVPAEPASVKVILNGKTIAEELVEIVANESVDVSVKRITAPVADSDAGSGDDGSDDDNGSDSGDDAGDGSDDDGAKDTGEDTETPTPARLPYLEAGLALDVAFRKFVFSDGTAPFDNAGEVLVGPAVEVWPGRLAGVPVLRGLSLFARVQFAATHQQVTRTTGGAAVGAETLWGGIEISLRHGWHFGKFGVEGSAGWVRDQAQFNAQTQSALDMVPSADYRSVRIGARVSYAVSFVEPYVGAENRFVLSGGDLANRGDTADTTGYRAGLGVRGKYGPIGGRVELSYGKYTWSYTNSMSGPSGATDKITFLSFLVGYDY